MAMCVLVLSKLTDHARHCKVLRKKDLNLCCDLGHVCVTFVLSPSSPPPPPFLPSPYPLPPDCEMVVQTLSLQCRESDTVPSKMTLVLFPDLKVGVILEAVQQQYL